MLLLYKDESVSNKKFRRRGDGGGPFYYNHGMEK